MGLTNAHRYLEHGRYRGSLEREYSSGVEGLYGVRSVKGRRRTGCLWLG
jgi:hypothetical protein